MSYIQDFETELTNLLNGDKDTAEIVRIVSERVLQSYRNGIKAGEKGATVIRDGKSRRGRYAPKAE